jgi:hypothetical protein
MTAVNRVTPIVALLVRAGGIRPRKRGLSTIQEHCPRRRTSKGQEVLTNSSRSLPSSSRKMFMRSMTTRATVGSSRPAGDWVNGRTNVPWIAASSRYVLGSAKLRRPESQGGWARAESDRGQPLLPARPMVEPGHRGPGHRPRPSHRPDLRRDCLQDGGPGHYRGEGPRPASQQGQAVRQRHGQRSDVRWSPHRRRCPQPA